ncbi:MAG: S8 family peptidase [Acidimicrobiales bacterium]
MVPEFRTRGHEIPRIVDDIRNLGRDQPSNQPPPRVAPNHVLYGINHVVIGPGRSPTRASQPFRSFPQTDVGHGVKIVVLDTGIIKHPLLASFDPAEIDPPNDSPVDSELDFEAGHGTFIEGVIRQYAPAADVMHKKVLTSEGRVSDTLLAQRLLSDCGDFDIINLSLGGYTHGNAGPFALPIVLEALRHKNPKQAVVAAAGNDHTDRPFFPAAMKAVIGVAACDDQDNRADYSNFGWWVDARAVGEHVSTFFDLPGQGQPGALNQHNSNQAAEFDWWASWAGTSFAAPVVVGAVAAEISANSGLTAREAAARLLVVNAPTWKPTLGVRIDPTDLTKTAA